jgi:hypothetical protein
VNKRNHDTKNFAKFLETFQQVIALSEAGGVVREQEGEREQERERVRERARARERERERARECVCESAASDSADTDVDDGGQRRKFSIAHTY